MIRAILLIKQARNELSPCCIPTRSVRCGSTAAVEARTMASVLAFMLFYGLSIAVFTSLLLLSGLDPITAFSAVFASVNNTGPGLGPVGPMGNFAVLSDFQIWVCTFAMLIGRLELLTVLVLFTPIFWRK